MFLATETFITITFLNRILENFHVFIFVRLAMYNVINSYIMHELC